MEDETEYLENGMKFVLLIQNNFTGAVPIVPEQGVGLEDPQCPFQLCYSFISMRNEKLLTT